MPKPKTSTTQLFLTTVLSLVILSGFGLSLYQYALNRSLWLDEAALALNIVTRGFLDLARPLDHYQLAPVGFLWAERSVGLLLGFHEYGLRILPLLGLQLSALLTYLFSYRLTQDRIEALLATSIFCTAHSTILYSSEVKPYATDVFFAVLIMYLSIRLPWNRVDSLILFGFLGVVAVWCSFPATIVLFVVNIYLFCSQVISKKEPRILVPIGCWGISLAIYYCLLIRGNPMASFMVRAWEGAFIESNPLTERFYNKIVHAGYEVFGRLLGYHTFWEIPALFSLLALAVFILQRKRQLLFYCTAPVLVHILLSILHVYPLRNRFVLYLMPIVAISYSAGLCGLFRYCRQKVPTLPVWVLAVPALATLSFSVMKFPIYREEIKPCLRLIQGQAQSGETLYVYYGALHAFEYYSTIGFIDIQNPVVKGSRQRRERHRYHQELRQLTGKVWLLFSHVPQWENVVNEEDYMVHFLLSQGANQIDVREYPGSSLYYIDTKKQSGPNSRGRPVRQE